MLTIVCEYCKNGPSPGVKCGQCVYAGNGTANLFEPLVEKEKGNPPPAKKSKHKKLKNKNTIFGKNLCTPNGTNRHSGKKYRNHAPGGRHRDVPRT